MNKYQRIINLLNDADIKVVDIGARGNPVKEFANIAKYVSYYAIEPDKKETSNIKKAISNFRNSIVINEAVSTFMGRTRLYITKQPGMSSLLNPNSSLVNEYFNGGICDIVKEELVNVDTLDAIAKHYNFTDACFLKVDAQGSEKDILRQSVGLLRDSLVGIYTEVLFQNFYKMQPYYSGIEQVLLNYGYSLFKLDITIRRKRNNIVRHSNPIPIWGNALFLKDKHLLKNDQQIAQQVMISLLYGFNDHAVELSQGKEYYDNVLKFVKENSKLNLRLVKEKLLRMLKC
jgi:FkbM family methyltransferase